MNAKTCFIPQMLHNMRMPDLKLEKKLLQAVISIACLVPLLAGIGGMLGGASFLGGGSVDMDSHLRYLSGLLFGIGLGFLSAVPNIESKGERIRLLTILVFIGGLARLFGLIENDVPGASMQFGLVMELAVTPLLCFWQYKFSKRFELKPPARQPSRKTRPTGSYNRRASR